MPKLEFSVASRGHIRAQITKLNDKVKSSINELTSDEVSSLFTRLEHLESELVKHNNTISMKVFDEHGDSDAFTSELETSDEYSEKICACKSLLQSRKVETDQRASSSPSLAIAKSKLKLPEIPLPKYSYAKGETLLSFLSAFESIVRSYHLSSYERFVYLKRQLQGPPLILVESLELAKQSYECAVELLKKAFASDISQKFDAIQRLRDLKCANKPYEFISEMRLIKELFSSLKIDSNTVLQFFVWQGLTSELQTQLINICNNNKPTLVEIEDNIFKALDRLSELNNKPRNQSKFRSDEQIEDRNVTNFAARVDAKNCDVKKNGFCSLCSDKSGPKVTSHTTRECPKYPTPKSKCDRLDSILACTLCGFLNHQTDDCFYKFRQTCLKCKGLHMTFLCRFDSREPAKPDANLSGKPKFNPKNNQPKKPNATNKNEGVNSGVVWTETALQTHVGGEAILPTFTCRIGNASVRVMKDSGCQPCFIERNLVNELSLPVLSNNLNVTVHGFNESKNYNTEEVEVTLSLNNSVHTVKAIVVPEIKTKLKVRGLGKIVQSFREKNYILADSGLTTDSDEIDNIRFVLGTNDAHVLVEKQVEFGEPIPSIYSLTEAGVLLFGNSRRMLCNLSFLNQNQQIFNKQCVVAKRACHSSSLEPHPNLNEVSMGSKNEDAIASSVVVDEEIDELHLKEATAQILNSKSDHVLCRETEYYDEERTEIDKKLIDITQNETTRTDEGRLMMPLAWKAKVSSSLATNFNLAKNVLKANEKKLLRNESQLLMIDQVFKEQEELGIIERVNDASFLELNPQHSYLAHMGVFKLERETSKCRVVFLSNLSQKTPQKVTLSHNQAMHSGPNLNHKITTALIHLRFDEKL